MPENDVVEPLLESEVLTEGAMLLEAGSAMGRLQVPKKGSLFEDDGTCTIAIIRPCISRGARLRGLPPIYTPRMLAENAAVFSNWLMYANHLTESIVENLQERGRTIQEMGGRIIGNTYWDPDVVFEEDEEFGYQKGAVVGKALPQPLVRTMLEADPGILHVSINAFPKSATPGTTPWTPTRKGMIVEGIRKAPEGSVDWVPRGGAGGRPLLKEWEEAVAEAIPKTFTQSTNPKRGASAVPKPDLKGVDRAELLEALTTDQPALLAELRGPDVTPTITHEVREGMSREEVTALLQEQAEQHATELSSLEESLEERAGELISERATATTLAEAAHGMIKRAGFKEVWSTDLKRRWAVLPSGPSPAIARVLEDATDEKPALQLLTEAVNADLVHASELIEAASGRRPLIAGLTGTTSGGDQGSKPKAPRNSAFRDYVREAKIIAPGEKPEDFDNGLREMVQEGVA